MTRAGALLKSVAGQFPTFAGILGIGLLRDLLGGLLHEYYRAAA